MTPGYERESLTARSQDLQSVVLPKLRESVFHVTSAVGFEGIEAARMIATNAEGKLGYTFPQSQNSYGRKRGYVCLFDLRVVSEEHLDHALHCFYFLDPFFRRADPVFLFLRADRYGEIIPWTATRNNYSAMWIPYIEAWYPGALPLTEVDRVLSVRVERPPPSLLEQAQVLAASNRQTSDIVPV